MIQQIQSEILWEAVPALLPEVLGVHIPYTPIVRSDNQRLLYMAGGRYEIFTNGLLQRLMNQLEKSGKFKKIGFSEYRNGKVVMGFMQFTEDTFKIAGFLSRDILVIGNTHDGSRRLKVSRTHFFIRCKNQYNAGENLLDLYHCNKFEVLKMADLIITKFVEDQNLQKNKWEKWASIQLEEDQIQKLASTITDFLTKSSEKVAFDAKKQRIMSEILSSVKSETTELGRNVFGLMNGITHFSTHWLMKNRTFLTDLDSAFKVNLLAAEFCESIANQSKS